MIGEFGEILRGVGIDAGIEHQAEELAAGSVDENGFSADASRLNIDRALPRLRHDAGVGRGDRIAEAAAEGREFLSQRADLKIV
jgi:hypothetical protein